MRRLLKSIQKTMRVVMKTSLIIGIEVSRVNGNDARIRLQCWTDIQFYSHCITRW